ncbi:MAG: methylenetetrahydrofolate reductase [NAD(P)H] [Thiotrichaceae bacterium]|nr:methylenetetrahydrofolate reductase [NAD(P)H] [Thiotrichaceae bacterium]
MKSQQIYPLAFSFECFPAKTEAGKATLLNTSHQLAKVNPCFFSVTYGAGGSTRERTLAAVDEINTATSIEVAPHIACIGASKDEMTSLLEYYKQRSIRHIIVLRGDTPSGLRDFGDFNYAIDLINFIREQYDDYFFIEVAAYPETHPLATNAQTDIENLQQKFECGADAALTQYFYNPDAFFRFIDECEKLGMDQPIVPGIMPITNYHQLARFSAMCGVEIPRWIRLRLEAYGDDLVSIRAFGEEVVSQLCEQLLAGGAAGLHFYTMNQSAPTLAIWNNLGLSSNKSTRARRQDNSID